VARLGVATIALSLSNLIGSPSSPCVAWPATASIQPHDDPPARGPDACGQVNAAVHDPVVPTGRDLVIPIL
jgi:hypothetical protein